MIVIPVGLWAQPGDANWDKVFGGNNTDRFYQVFEVSNGMLIAVGETQSNTNGGTDGLLVISDFSTGSKLVERKLGGKKDDGLRTVVQTYTGNFILGGYTFSEGHGKADAWLVCINERGQTLWTKTFGTSNNDRIEHLLLLPEGDLAFSGTRNDQKEGDLWVGRLQDTTLIWESNVGKGLYASVTGMVLSADNGLVMTGNAADEKGNIYLLKISEKGRELWKRTFGEKGWEEATGLIATYDNGYAISGLTNSTGAGETDCWLVKTNGEGTLQWSQAFGGRDADMANCIVQLPTNDFLLGGTTRSYRSGARKPKAYLVMVASGGNRKWEYSYGGAEGDEIQSLAVLHNTSIVMAGATASRGEGGDDAWLVKWPPFVNTDLAGGRAAEVKLEQPALKTKDGLLKPGEQTYLSVVFNNTTGANLQDVQLQVSSDANAGFRIWETNYAGTVVRDQKFEFKVPVTGYESLTTSQTQLKLTLSSGNTTLQTSNFILGSKLPQEADVEISDYDFVDSRQSDDNTLSVEVRNPGDYPAKNVSVRFEMPPGIVAKSGANQDLGTIPAKGSKKVNLVYQKNTTYRDNRLAISCVIKMGQREFRKTLERGSRSNDDVVLILTEPQETETNLQRIISEGNVYNIKVAASSTTPLKQQDFKVYNNNLAIDGGKMDEVDLKNREMEDNRFTYFYNRKVRLHPGENKVDIIVKTSNGEFRTKQMTIYFEPRQPNLHVLAVGPTHKDLQYTSRDAADFAKAFENQAGTGKLYGKVFVRSLVTAEDSEADDIREAFSDLAFEYQNPASDVRILDNDVLMVFISTHGKNTKDGFVLLPSNYDPRYEDTRVVNFQNDIVKKLDQINCKKIVFIDACQSGAADSKSLSDVTRADMLTKLAAMHPGMSTLTSCRANELSYEDAAWQNGAFTEAMMEAFSDRSCQDNQGNFKADADNNKVVTLGELYDFLQRRVPELVKTQKPQAPTNQIPFMPENQLNKEDTPIYVIEQ